MLFSTNFRRDKITVQDKLQLGWDYCPRQTFVETGLVFERLLSETNFCWGKIAVKRVLVSIKLVIRVGPVTKTNFSPIKISCQNKISARQNFCQQPLLAGQGQESYKLTKRSSRTTPVFLGREPGKLFICRIVLFLPCFANSLGEKFGVYQMTGALVGKVWKNCGHDSSYFAMF